METLPAVMIGGPPHAGKSTLAYHLSMALRRRRVAHYVLRAAPDGEGDWSYQADTQLVRAIRIKGAFTQMWTDRICRDITNRHLPLIVDMGGMPQTSQEEIFDRCTHAVLLSLDEPSRAFWHGLASRYGLILVADLRSDLHGQDEIEATSPVLRGTIAGLDRYQPRLGATFQALVDRLADLFAYDERELRRLHLAQAPADVEIVVDMQQLAETLKADPLHWEPTDLPKVLAYLPDDAPLALYGRAPAWLYAAIARHVADQDFFQFDARLGWVRTPTLAIAPPSAQAPLQATVIVSDAYTQVVFALPHHYVDYLERDELVAPPIPSDRGVVLNGKLPHWLWTALARAYRTVPWLAIYSPQHAGMAVVVGSRVDAPALGALVPVKGAEISGH